MIIELATIAYVSSGRSFSSPSRSYSSSSSYRSSSSSFRSSSSPRSWSSSAKYGTGSASRVGTSKLKSSTTPPKPHTYGGRSFNSSDAQYTNTNGVWVWYWIAVADDHSDKNKKNVECFDKNHKRTTCNRDSKSYKKDW